MSDLLKRPGRIYVSREMIETNPDMVRDVFAPILVVEARTRFVTNDVEFICYCEEFEEQDDGNVIPEYTIDLTQDGDDYTVEFSKVD